MFASCREPRVTREISSRALNQADALMQLITWVLRNSGPVAGIDSFGPIVFAYHESGWIEQIGEDEDGIISMNKPYYDDDYGAY
jgi:hypothetical protein